MSEDMYANRFLRTLLLSLQSQMLLCFFGEPNLQLTRLTPGSIFTSGVASVVFLPLRRHDVKTLNWFEKPTTNPLTCVSKDSIKPRPGKLFVWMFFTLFEHMLSTIVHKCGEVRRTRSKHHLNPLYLILMVKNVVTQKIQCMVQIEWA